MSAIAASTNVPVSVKCRIGVDDHDSYNELCKVLLSAISFYFKFKECKVWILWIGFSSFYKICRKRCYSLPCIC